MKITEKEFISEDNYTLIEKGEVSHKCPSNIALVKYWGKYENQIPANPSLSYTLTNSFTETKIEFNKSDKFKVEVYLDGRFQESFTEKIKKYFLSLKKYLLFIDQYHYKIYTENNFPHSSGIASSASGFGALAKCLIEMSKILSDDKLSEEFKLKKTSFIARLGSGSACRSLYNGLVLWGEHPDIIESSNLYAVPYPLEINSVFETFIDTVLLLDEGVKEVSSSVGHQLMNEHPYASVRFNEATKNITKLISILKEGDLESFGYIVENEALSLHSMMMTSKPSFILLKPATLLVIDKIWKFRKNCNAHLYFSIDAGANIHLLYPEKDKGIVSSFIQNDLIKFTENGNLISNQISFLK